MAILRLPALIDPHFHPIDADRNRWRTIAAGAASAGYDAIQIMPDFEEPIDNKLALIKMHNALKDLNLSFFLTLAGTPSNIETLKQSLPVKAIKVWLGTGPEELVVDKEEDLRKILLSTDKVVMIHAEDESTLLRNYEFGNEELAMNEHGRIFDRAAAVRATVKAITAAKETGRRIYLCHISTADEIILVRKAKEKGIRVYAEAAPHHLLLTQKDEQRLGTLSKVNPPLRTAEDQLALWEALNDGTIDTVGSDTHLWLEKEKLREYNRVPEGFPNLEITLPLLLTAVIAKKIPLQRVIELTSTNSARIFSIPKPNRSIFVDMDNPRPVNMSLCDWHPFAVDSLVGWPVRQTATKRH